MANMGPFELGFRLDELEERFMQTYGWGRFRAQCALARRLGVSDRWLRYLKRCRNPGPELRKKILRRYRYIMKEVKNDEQLVRISKERS